MPPLHKTCSPAGIHLSEYVYGNVYIIFLFPVYIKNQEKANIFSEQTFRTNVRKILDTVIKAQYNCNMRTNVPNRYSERTFIIRIQMYKKMHSQ